MSRVICDKKTAAREKGKINKTFLRSAMMCGLEMKPLRKREEVELSEPKFKMLRFSMRGTEEQGWTGVEKRTEMGTARGAAQVEVKEEHKEYSWIQ